jgi:two-component system response regulator MprA
MSGSLPSDEPLVVFTGPDEHLCSAVTAAFADHGIATLTVDKRRAEAAVCERRVTAVVIDASGDMGEALDLCRRLRRGVDGVPIVTLAQDAVSARIALLEAGADDCLSKPFAPRELVTRVQVVQRRAGVSDEPAAIIEYDDLRIDVPGRQAWRGGRPLDLTRTEFALLAVLAEHAERVVERKQLLIAVWGYDFGPEFHSLGVYVGYVRRKLEAAGEPRLVQTVRGVGYVLRPER